MANPRTWQIEWQKLIVVDDQEESALSDGDEPYLVFFGFRSRPQTAGSTQVFWTHYLDDEWAEGAEDDEEFGIPPAMGSLAFPDVELTTAADLVSGGRFPELIGMAGIAFESDSTPFSVIHALMNNVQAQIHERVTDLVEDGQLDPQNPGPAIQSVIQAVQNELSLNIPESIAVFFASFTDPDDVIEVKAKLWVAGDPSLQPLIAADFLREEPLELTFSGDGATYKIQGSTVRSPGPGHAMPATVALADREFALRRTKLLRAWGLNLRYKQRGDLPLGKFPRWNDDGTTAMRQIAAGMAVFADRTGAFNKDDWATFSGLAPENTREQHRDEFVRRVELYFDEQVAAFKDIGTAGDEDSGVKGKHGGDYDFFLRDVIALIFIFRDEPEILTCRMIRKLIGQDQVVFSAPDAPCGAPSDCTATGHVPFSGQDLDEWLAAGPGGRHYYKDYVVKLGVRVGNYSLSVPETENHLLGIYTWRFLVNEYLTWVASLPLEHKRYDPCLRALVQSDPQRYINGPEIVDWVLQLLGRVPHSGMFETNAKPYQAYALLPMMAFYQAADQLFPNDPVRKQIKVAAQNALDYLAAEYAFQSFQGKRMAPIRRNSEHQANVGFYASDYVAHIFGILTGAYVYSDDNGAANTAADACSGGGSVEPCWASPYHWSSIDQAGGFALWSLLSGYRVPPAIHDYMLNKHGGYFARIQTRYSDRSYPFYYAVNPSLIDFIALFLLNPALPIPAALFSSPAPEFARPRYFQDVAAGKTQMADYDVAGPGRFKPATQLYFAAPTYLNSSGGRSIDYYDDDLLEAAGGLSSSLEKALHGHDVYSKPSTIIPRGNLQILHQEDIGALERLLPTMRGNDAFQLSNNLSTYKSFTVGYTFNPDDDDRHQDWPQRYPGEWNEFQVAEFGINRALFRVFDFTAQPEHPLAGHFWVLARFSKSSSDGQFRHYGRGFWEVVPGHQFATADALVAQIKDGNPASHFTDGDDHFFYRLASTGERVMMHKRLGSSGAAQSIVAIHAPDGSNIPLNIYTADVRNEGQLRSLPLMDVWQVDRDYQFTGMKYAYADGRGRVVIHNPFVGHTLTLDSSDYRAPARSLDPVSIVTTQLPAIDGTQGQKPGVSALALGEDVIYATHYAAPDFFEPSTLAGELLALDRHTLAPLKRVTVGKAPDAIAIHHDTRRLYVVNYQDHSLSVVDGDSFALLNTLVFQGWGEHSVAVSQKYHRVFVGQGGQQRVLVIDGPSGTQLAPMNGLPLGGNLVLDEATDRLFHLVLNAQDQQRQDLVEWAIGAQGQDELRRVSLDRQISRPSELAFDAERLYVLHNGARPNLPAGQKLTVLDRRTLEVVGVVPLRTGALGVAASASQHVIYVSTQYDIYVIDGHSLQVLRTVPLAGYQPKGAVAIDERTGAAYYGGAGSSLLTLSGAPYL